jgi:hypothetical protein
LKGAEQGVDLDDLGIEVVNSTGDQFSEWRSWPGPGSSSFSSLVLMIG